jgi:hypothetical protein
MKIIFLAAFISAAAVVVMDEITIINASATYFSFIIASSFSNTQATIAN